MQQTLAGAAEKPLRVGSPRLLGQAHPLPGQTESGPCPGSMCARLFEFLFRSYGASGKSAGRISSYWPRQPAQPGE
jgi:hypothetical protein